MNQAKALLLPGTHQDWSVQFDAVQVGHVLVVIPSPYLKLRRKFLLGPGPKGLQDGFEISAGIGNPARNEWINFGNPHGPVTIRLDRDPLLNGDHRRLHLNPHRQEFPHPQKQIPTFRSITQVTDFQHKISLSRHT